MNYINNIDWLQFSFVLKEKRDTSLFLFEKRKYATSMFLCVEDIVNTKTNEIVAELLSEARENFFEKGFCILKIKNRYLYTKEFFKIFYDLRKSLIFEKYNICRIDLCRDFTKFKYGLTPEKFIKAAFNTNIILVGKGNVPNKTNVKMKIDGTFNYKPVQKDTHIEYEETFYTRKHGITNVPETFSIGTGHNIIQRKLYDKTKEMQDKTHKPYISEMHNNYLQPKQDEHVWRLEFVIKGTYLDLVTTATKEKKSLQIEDLTQENIDKMMDFLVEKFYSWRKKRKRKNSENIINDIRYWDKLQLFDAMYSTLELELLLSDTQSDSNRSKKIYLKAWALMEQDSRTLKEIYSLKGFNEDEIEIYKKMDGLMKQQFMREYNLSTYYKTKIEPFISHHHINEKPK
jgi:hypothetical protein